MKEEDMKGRTVVQMRVEAFAQRFYDYIMCLVKRGKKGEE